MESFSLFSDCWSYDSLKDFRQISPLVQTRIRQEYVLECCFLIAAAVGAYLHLLWNIGGVLTTFAIFGCVLATDPPYVEDPDPPYLEPKRDLLLMASYLFEGASAGPVINLTVDYDKSHVVSIFMGCGIAYACFSGAATLSTRREFLYLGAILSSGVSIFFWLLIASKIFGGKFGLYPYEFFQLYIWLLVFVGYLVAQTQVLILEISSM